MAGSGVALRMMAFLSDGWGASGDLAVRPPSVETFVCVCAAIGLGWWLTSLVAVPRPGPLASSSPARPSLIFFTALREVGLGVALWLMLLFLATTSELLLRCGEGAMLGVTATLSIVATPLVFLGLNGVSGASGVRVPVGAGMADIAPIVGR